MRRALGDFWLSALFWTAEYAPRLVRGVRPLFTWGAFTFSLPVRGATLANARRLLGPNATHRECVSLAKAVIGNFYLFCCDVAYTARLSPEQLLDRIERVDGHEHFETARRAGRGLIVVTAHMGSFEVGMAALRQQESRINVVFQRDSYGRFERQRSQLRNRLGVTEAPVGEGWTLWMRLRDALLRGEFVVLQGDRVMPGQKGVRVPFLGATTMLPGGPVKLALVSGAPILPVFTVGAPGGKVRVCVEPPITVEPGADDAALLKLASVLERYVRSYPEQWLMIHPACCDDAINPNAIATRESRDNL